MALSALDPALHLVGIHGASSMAMASLACVGDSIRAEGFPVFSSSCLSFSILGINHDVKHRYCKDQRGSLAAPA